MKHCQNLVRQRGLIRLVCPPRRLPHQTRAFQKLRGGSGASIQPDIITSRIGRSGKNQIQFSAIVQIDPKRGFTTSRCKMTSACHPQNSVQIQKHLPPTEGRYVGRVWRPNIGPSVVTNWNNELIDLTLPLPNQKHFGTVTSLIESTKDKPSQLLPTLDMVLQRRVELAECRVGPTLQIFENTQHFSKKNKIISDSQEPVLLAPIDLQAVKAAGVTFVKSMLERVIEEQARGDPAKANEIRHVLKSEIGDSLRDIQPGSAQAEKVKSVLMGRNLWSQYLEVGLGKYAEIFTKSQPLASMGYGAKIGLHPESGWNNPEPEIVLVVDSQGTIVGATLGNDVNLRDFEGRSALLLSKAKDNNGSCSIGPLIRLFDANFSLDSVRNCDLTLSIDGPDNFTLNSGSSMSQISRDPTSLVSHTISPSHQYPDGFVLFTGTMFAPTEDRQAEKPGEGFTHMEGDVVTISTPHLGALVNFVSYSDRIPPWVFGIQQLMENLAKRKVL